MGRWDYISGTSISIINQELKDFVVNNHKTNHWELLKVLSSKTNESIYNIVCQGTNTVDKKLKNNAIRLTPYTGTKRQVTPELLGEIIETLDTSSLGNIVFVLNFCGYKYHRKMIQDLLKNLT